MSDIIVSQMDIEHLKIIRQSIIDFMIYVAKDYAKKPGILLDIAPQIYEGAKPFFLQSIKVETFDINPASGCTYIGDICTYNNCLKNDSFDYIVCTEVLEHTLQPFNAVAEIWRILKPGGIIFLSVPFNLRIHGPLPDCWRFTEHGLRVLLKDFSILELKNIETLERQLMPVHYTVVAEKLIK